MVQDAEIDACTGKGKEDNVDGHGRALDGLDEFVAVIGEVLNHKTRRDAFQDKMKSEEFAFVNDDERRKRESGKRIVQV